MDINQDKTPYRDELSEILNRKREKYEQESESEPDFEEEVKEYRPDNQFRPNDELPNDDIGSGDDLSDDDVTADEELHDMDFDISEDEDDTEKTYKKKNKKAAEAEKRLRRDRQARKTILRILAGIVVTGFVFFLGIKLGSVVFSVVMDYAGISSNEFVVQIELPPNPTLDQVADVLEENGIISNPDFFKKYVEMKKEKKNITGFVEGKFTLSSSMNYSTIIDTLLASKNQRVTVEITIIEGMTAYDIGQLLEENFVCKASDFQKFYRKKLNVYDFEQRIIENNKRFNQMEGYLFPDKYEFYVCNELKENPDTDADTTKEAEVAAKKIYSNFNSKITKTMYKKMHEMGFNLDEFIALSSMIQAEVNNTDDMKLVASVFLNRLHSNGAIPKLQSDPTVHYVQDYIEPYYKDYNLTTSLAVISNSYDTYECDGVPVGAICNPGIEAMNALLDAPETDYYYFCANLETGETYYAKTIEEHEANLVKAGLR